MLYWWKNIKTNRDMKKNIITIIIATIIASFTTTYAQTVKPFYTEREWRTIQLKEKKSQIKREKAVPSPLREAQKAKQQRAKNTTPTDTLYMRALRAAQKAQDIEMEDTLLAINTSDTIRTLETIKWLSKYASEQQSNEMLYGCNTYDSTATYACYIYSVAVLNDYLSEVERNRTDLNDKRVIQIMNVKREIDASMMVQERISSIAVNFVD